MANNKISYELCAAAEAAENGVRRTWSPEQYADYAAKLDWLVGAAGNMLLAAKCTDDYQNWDGGTLHQCVNELTAALRDIDLESK